MLVKRGSCINEERYTQYKYQLYDLSNTYSFLFFNSLINLSNYILSLMFLREKRHYINV